MASSFSSCWEDPHKLVQALEKEKHKIHAFKRELPLCMHLLNDAIERAYLVVSTRKPPVLEEFMPKYCAKTEEQTHPQPRDEDDKKPAAANWQLWSHPEVDNSRTGAFASLVHPKCLELPAILKDDLKLSSPSSPAGCSPELMQLRNQEPLLSLEDDEESRSQHFPRVGSSNSYQQQQQQRKSRRCWSPELHRRFVGALQQLGGPQVATPKQIRELMKVEGLTNDEVKSHLQKYRLHTRRPSCGTSSPISASAAAAAAPASQVVVLGSIWVPTEYAHGNTILSLNSTPPATNPQEARDFFTSLGPVSSAAYHHERMKAVFPSRNTSPSVSKGEDDDVSYDGDVTEV